MLGISDAGRQATVSVDDGGMHPMDRFDDSAAASHHHGAHGRQTSRWHGTWRTSMYSTGWVGALEGLDGSAPADSTPLSQFEPEAPDGTASAAVSLSGLWESPAARNSVCGDSEFLISSMALLS